MYIPSFILLVGNYKLFLLQIWVFEDLTCELSSSCFECVVANYPNA